MTLHQTARLLCFVSAGEVFVHEDGSFEIAPLSLWRRKGGGFIFRVGRNTYWFNADGAYDGPEFKLNRDIVPPERQAALIDALNSCPDNRNQAPAEAYFAEDAPGYKDETAVWPKEARKPAPPRPQEHVYQVQKSGQQHNCVLLKLQDAVTGFDLTAVQPTSFDVEPVVLGTGEKMVAMTVRHLDQVIAFLLDGEQAREMRDALDKHLDQLTHVVSREDTRH
jgi:hypothetical protein